VNFPKTFSHLATREAGEKAREYLKDVLKHNDSIIFNLGNKNLTPSFVDSSLAVLAMEVGFETFQKKVKFQNASESTKILIKNTLTKRRSQIRKKSS